MPTREINVKNALNFLLIGLGRPELIGRRSAQMEIDEVYMPMLAECYDLESAPDPRADGVDENSPCGITAKANTNKAFTRILLYCRAKIADNDSRTFKGNSERYLKKLHWESL